MSAVFLEIGTENKNVIHISSTELVEVSGKSFIDVGLEGRRTVAKTKREDKVFKEAITGGEGSLPFVPLLDA